MTLEQAAAQETIQAHLQEAIKEDRPTLCGELWKEIFCAVFKRPPSSESDNLWDQLLLHENGYGGLHIRRKLLGHVHE